MSSERTRLINAPRSIIPACDVRTLDVLLEIAEASKDVDGVGALKIGLTLIDRFGIPEIKERLAQIGCEKPLIVDMQKAGTDIPEMDLEFAEVMAESHIPAAILFPLAGPVTQTQWTAALQAVGVLPIIGGHMTHPGFLVSDGGYIADDAPERIYRRAIEQGVRDFVLPGNQPEIVEKYTHLFDAELGDGNYDELSPGFIKQGGVYGAAAKVAGKYFHGIIGTAIHTAADKAAVIKELTSQLGVQSPEFQAYLKAIRPAVEGIAGKEPGDPNFAGKPVI